MVIIFAFSSQPADLSGETSEGIALLLFPQLAETDPEVVGEVNHVIRKCAHAFVYALLGGFAAGFTLSFRSTIADGCLFAVLPGWGCAVLYAISDEIHQMFVPGRGPAVIDVLLDSTGAALGAAAAALIWVLT
ncbi:MAG: VanZ family protein, partial [Clostridia bacterium]|nr:VanZ family protein [Clostridia bacterium]